VVAEFTDPPEARYEANAGAPEIRECPLIKLPFFVTLMVKVMMMDVLLTLITIALILVHRMHIIPARRRFKIIMGIKRGRAKRALKKRARSRLRRLLILRRRARRNKRGSSSSSSSRTYSLYLCLKFFIPLNSE
ncbi:hypothetical protein Tcan_02959, partial [Toxocara canis]